MQMTNLYLSGTVSITSCLIESENCNSLLALQCHKDAIKNCSPFSESVSNVLWHISTKYLQITLENMPMLTKQYHKLLGKISKFCFIYW
jgi:hypothetical protein